MRRLCLDQNSQKKKGLSLEKDNHSIADGLVCEVLSGDG